MKNELITLTNPKSIVSESIKTIRTNIQFSSVGQNIKTILVTSSMPGEGKSFISSNLACSFAQMGKKVLLIDSDMRKGRVHEIFKLKSMNGLSDLLIDNIDENFDKYLIKTEFDNLSVITRGTIPANPSELLNSPVLKYLLEKLKEQYDYIIIDGVPVQGLSDSLILANSVDKVIIVSSINLTPVDMIVKTKKALNNIGADIAGVVVNKVPNFNKGYYGYYE